MASIILCKDVLRWLGSKAALIVIGHAVTGMLGFVDAVHVDAEERIRKDARRCAVGKTEMDKHGSDKQKNDALAVLVAANVGVLGANDGVLVAVPIYYMLLDHL